MATRRQSILGSANVKPDDSGNCFIATKASVMSNDLYHGTLWGFANAGAAKIVLGLDFRVPQDFSSGMKFRCHWVSTNNANAIVNTIDYTTASETGSWDPAAHEESMTATKTVSGTARNGFVQEFTPAANFAVGELVQLHVGRDKSSGSDTHAATAYLADVEIEYTA